MDLLYLSLLFSTAFGPASAEEECNGTTAVYVAPGGRALLQVTDWERAFCPGRCHFNWRRRRGFRSVASEWDPSSITPCRDMPDCRVLPGGSLELSRITPEEAGDYTLLMLHEDDALHPEERETRLKCFLLQLQDPVSEPKVESMCGPDGTVHLICRVKNGTHLSHSWSVAGGQGNTSFEKITWQGPLLINVTCTARNQISEETSQPRNISCVDVCTGSTDMVYAALGGSFLLQITDSELAPCPGACDFKWTKDGDLDVAMVKSRGSFTWCPYSPSCQVFSNGSLELSRITPGDAGHYSVRMDHGSGRNFRKCFLVNLLGKPESAWERAISILRVILIAITLVAGIVMVRWHFA